MSLQVIGAGFGRTGTASLKIALETLLSAPCYHMSEVLGQAGHVDLWLEAASGRADWQAIFGAYKSTVDFPACSYWRELAQAFPDAKVLLSVRDPRRWFQSTQETIFSTVLQDIHQGTKWGSMIEATINDHLDGDLNDSEAMIAAFDNHIAAVKSSIEPERLLVFDASEGWAPLCEFLGCEQPDGDFPHVNSKEEFDGVFELLRSPVGAMVMDGKGIQESRLHDDMFGKD